jgi:2-polyprenyl-3-methyl-5-hydroxy-6-metoxy-1,4-benzoquinol methylase
MGGHDKGLAQRRPPARGQGDHPGGGGRPSIASLSRRPVPSTPLAQQRDTAGPTLNDKIMYSRWARYYDALYAFIDYAAESARITETIRRFHPQARTLLDVACGTGKHMQHLAADFQVEGVDANDEFLDVIRGRSPGTPVHCSKMEVLDLGRRYDVVCCLFSSIGFVRTVEALQQTMRNFAQHLNPGGLVLIEPWFSRENFWAGRINALYVDEPELKIAMMYTTAVVDGLSILANQILVGTPGGMETLHEDHVLGLFSPAEYVEAMAQAGLEPLCSLDPQPGWRRGLHVARKPG